MANRSTQQAEPTSVYNANMLNEHEVLIGWRQLFTNKMITTQSLDRAKALIDELRAESPLRHRLSTELNELRTLHQKKPLRTSE